MGANLIRVRFVSTPNADDLSLVRCVPPEKLQDALGSFGRREVLHIHLVLTRPAHCYLDFPALSGELASRGKLGIVCFQPRRNR